MSIKERVALITGAGRGVGQATARLFAQSGARVVLFGRTRAHIEEVAAQITTPGGHAMAVSGDVSRETDVLSLFQSVKESYGQLDWWCAAIVAKRPFAEMERRLGPDYRH
ncbi:MAG: SDR family NAD(P)-dependent oxidoreductase [Ktedonobacteraceae bacterium]|nr:SDR family NAD(P)-dependent oxidoreductase [Ktedonobacteraceae bacterium]